MSIGEWILLIVVSLFTVLMVGALISYVARLFRSTKPYQRKR